MKFQDGIKEKEITCDFNNLIFFGRSSTDGNAALICVKYCLLSAAGLECTIFRKYLQVQYSIY